MNKMITITLALKTNPYDIFIGENALNRLPALIKKNHIGTDAVVLTTPVIEAGHGKKLKTILAACCASVKTIRIPDSEKSKNAGLALKLIEKITAFDTKKRIFLIAFGGGVVGDLTGFIAAIYKRGIPYIQIPTTLLSQIDSSIGGKTAVDTSFGKNLIGAFYQPKFVLADTNLLKTLPKNQLLAGLSEAIKYGVIKDKNLFSFLEKNYQKILRSNTKTLTHLISRSCAIKAGIVALDEFDKTGQRIILNFGHTFGHAVEAASKFRINHGEAVAIGMNYACRLSVKKGFLKNEEARRITSLIEKTGLPIQAKGIGTKAILKAMAYDKKFTKGINRFVLLERIGKTKIVENIPADILIESIETPMLSDYTD